MSLDDPIHCLLTSSLQVMLIIPTSAYIRLSIDPVVESGKGISTLVQRLFDAYDKEERNDKAREDLYHCCASILDGARRHKEDYPSSSSYYSFGYERRREKFTDAELGNVAICVARLGDAELFQHLLRTLRVSLALSEFENIAHRLGPARFLGFRSVLMEAIGQYNTITAKLIAIKNLRQGFWNRLGSLASMHDEFFGQFDSWSQSVMETTLKSKQLTTPDDGKALLRVTEIFGSEFMFEQ